MRSHRNCAGFKGCDRTYFIVYVLLRAHVCVRKNWNFSTIYTTCLVEVWKSNRETPLFREVAKFLNFFRSASAKKKSFTLISHYLPKFRTRRFNQRDLQISLSEGIKSRGEENNLTRVEFPSVSPIKCERGQDAGCVAKSTVPRLQLYKWLAGSRTVSACSAGILCVLRGHAVCRRESARQRVAYRDRGQASGRRERSEVRPRRAVT